MKPEVVKELGAILGGKGEPLNPTVRHRTVGFFVGLLSQGARSPLRPGSVPRLLSDS